MNFWTHDNGVTQGPYTEEQLRLMWGNGIITANALCCRDGENDWVPVTTIFQPRTDAIGARPVVSEKARIATSKTPQNHSKDVLLRIVSYREAMVSAYVVSVLLSWMTTFINAPVMLVIALLSWVVSAITFFMIVRALNGSVLAAIIAFVAALVPLLCLVTVFFLYGWAERDLKDAGVTLASSAKMKQQIKRMSS